MRTTFSRISGMTEAQRDALVEQFDKASRIAAAEPVAVIGVGCRFPGRVFGPDDYWKFLARGGDGIVEVPADRWDADAYYDEDPLAPGRMPSKWGGFLSDVTGFDADFFGITPREAEAMDPQQRVLLEVAWEALEHAGLAPEELGGTRAGVMMGVYYNEFQSSSAANPDTIDAYSATGNAHSVTVGRISYLLGLRGPAVAVDTACSSSLVAIHLACQSLRMRESDLALAGGVNVILRPETQLALAKWGMLSPRGHCHAFDAGADGFVRGEGAGVVVLKRLTDAVRDGDRVLAVVRGSAVNSDGRSNGLTAPNAPAQREVITRALKSSDVAPASVNFIETHGTGTALGDPIEFDALSAVYGRGDAPCALGAVKTNMGHLEAAAGIAGFIKAVLAVQRAEIPPNLHFSQWNPAIDAAATRLFVPTDATPWPQSEGPRRAGVSSFGLGGTNAHIVLEQGPDPAPPPNGAPMTTLTLSGRSTERVKTWASAMADWLDGSGSAVSLPNVAHTLDRQRGRSGTFAAVCARDQAQAVAGLRAVAAGQHTPCVVGPVDTPYGPGTVFVYSGQGSQWAGMGRRLLAEEPAFAAAVAELEPIFVEQVGFSLRQVLESGESVVGIDRIQPVLVGLQLALTALWRASGVEPDAVIGHSMGEVAAAVVAGALSPADGLKVIATRSKLMARLSGKGAMALVELDAEAAARLIADHPDVTLAVHASPRQTVIAGPPAQVDALIAEVQSQNRLARRIEVDVASHHPTVDPILPELREALSGLAPAAPQIPLLSTADPDGAAAPRMDADYWVANLRNPVRFSQAVTAAAAEHGTFIEISPHPLLTHGIAETLDSARPRGDVRVVGTLNRDDDETLTFHTNLATARPAPAAAPSAELADIPPRPWLHVPFWMAARPGAGTAAGEHPLLGTHVEMPSSKDHVWQTDVDLDVLPWLADHKVHGQPIMPAAGFAEMALAAAGAALRLPAREVALHRLEVEQMLPLDGRTRLITQLVRGDDGAIRVEVHSRSAGGTWNRHAVARVAVQQGTQPARPGALSGTVVAPGDFYAALRRTGAHHGQGFAALTRIVRAAGGASEAEIVLPDEATPDRGYRIHPVMLDAALQALAAAMPAASLAESAEATFLPVSIESLRVFGEVGRRARCHAELVSLDDEGSGKLGKFTLTDEGGTVLAEATGIYLRRVQRRTVPLPLEQKVFESAWVGTAAPPRDAGAVAEATAPGSWLVLSHDPETKAIAEDFAARFGAETRRVIGADMTDESAVLAAFASAAADPERPPAGVVVLVENGSFDGTDAEGATGRAQDLVWAVSTAAKAVVGGWHGKPPRLWAVARNGLAVRDDEGGDPAVGALKGLVRVLAYEHPGLRATLLDLDDAGDVVGAMMAELVTGGRDDVIAWRGDDRFAERLTRATLGERRQDPVVRRDGSYIVTGGLGGLGLVVARWLVDSGAGRVVLTGRREPSDEDQAQLALLEGDAQISYLAGDIAAPGIAEQLVAAAESTGLPLRGLVHSAAVIDDGLVTGLSKESLDRVWAPKATGALRLHEATASRHLDWWVGFSSVASLLGSPGQGAYACANAWLDALVAWRRAAGLPATSINWGQWSEVGIARSLSLDVLDPISPAEGIEAMEALVGRNLAQAGVARLRLDRAAAAFPEISELGYFARMVEELDAVSEGGDWSGVEGLRELVPGEVIDAVVARLRARIAAIMGYAGDAAVDPDQPLTELGMDSLMAVRIRNTVRADFGVEPPVALLLQGATPKDLAADLVRQLGLTAPEQEQRSGGLRDRAQQRAAARQRAATRRKAGQ
jgi:phthiocerol/phenolphthiocerol synthesis type-I polyketide synthase D